MYPKIEDVKEVVVGNIYNVPALQFDNTTTSTRIMPITGPCHDDIEIVGFVPRHYHYDHRFISNELYGEVYNICGFMGYNFDITKVAVIQLFEHYNMTYRQIRSDIVCARQMPAFPLLDFSEKLSDAFEHKKVSCGKCPHRGLPLNALPFMLGSDCVVQCPGHGLKWDLNTGKMVR